MQEAQFSKVTKVGFKLFYEIEAKIQSYPFVANICLMGQLFTIMFYMLINSTPSWTPVKQYFESFLEITDLFLAILVLVDVLLRLTIFTVSYKLYNELGTLKEHKNIINICNILHFILAYLAEIGYYAMGLYLFWRMNGSNSSTWTFMFLCTGSTGYLLQSIALIENRLYKLFSLMIAPMMINLSLEFSVISLFIISMLMLRNQKQFEKLLYFIVSLACLWCYIQLNYSPNGQYYLCFINFIIILGCCVGVFFLYPTPISQSILEENQRLLYKAKCRENRRNTRQQDQQISVEDEQIYEKYLQDVQHIQQVCLPLYVRRMPFHKWNKQGMTNLLWDKIRWDKQNHPSFEMDLFYFSTGINLKKNILQLMKDMANYFQENKSSYNLSKNYKIYKTSHKIFSSYQQFNAKNDAAVQISDIIHAEQSYHQFHIGIEKILTEIAQYWRQLAHKKFQVLPEIQDKILIIMELHKQLKKLIQQLADYPIQNERLLFDLISKLVNNYHSAEHFCFQDQIQQSNSTFQYLILEGESIQKISLKLLRSMNYERQELEHHSIRTLIPNHFHLYLDQIYAGFLQRDQHNNFFLPLLHSNGCFIMMNCMLYMLPSSSNSGVKLLLTLVREGDDKSQLFLLNVNRQRIELLNEQMRLMMGVSPNTLRKLSQGEMMFFANDFFLCDLSCQEVQKLASHDILNTKIIYKDFLKNKNYSYNNEITLRLEQQFQFDQHYYMVVVVLSESFKQFRTQKRQRTQTYILSENKQCNLAEAYENEQFFCRIENPYKSKIVQKLSNIKNRSIRSYFYQISLLKICLFILIVGNIVIFKLFSNNQLEYMSTIAETMYNRNNQYINLLRLYSSSYSNILFTRNPLATKNYIGSLFFSTMPNDSTLVGAIANLSNYYNKQTDLNSHGIEKTYLQNKDLTGVPQSSYQLNFSLFQINTNTQLSTFYDFIIAAEEGFSDGSDLPFFASNYNNILSIMPTYQSYLKFSENFNSKYNIEYAVIYSFASVMALLVLYGYAITFKMIELHTDLKQLYNFIQPADIDKVTLQLEKIKTIIGGIQADNDNIDNIYEYQQILTKKSLMISESMKSIKGNAQKAQNSQSNHPTCKTKVQRSCRFMILCPLLLAYIAVTIYFQNINMSSDQTDFLSILSLLQKIQVDEMWIQRYYLDLYQPSYYKQLFGNYTNPYESSTIIKNHFYSDAIPSFFKQDANNKQNLCQNTYIVNITIPFFSLNQSISACSEIQSGVLMNGYSQSLQMFESNIRVQIKNDFSSYLSPKLKGTMNNLLEIIFTRQVLTNYLQVKSDNFFSDLDLYKIDSSGQDNQLIGYAMCLWAGLTIVLVYNVIQLRRQMSIAIHLICIIPASAMFNMRMTNFIRKYEILSKIDQL